jgi:methylglutaconyl-CoA hydratase
MDNEGKVTVNIINGTGSIDFYHPKSNSLPGKLLKQMSEEVDNLSNNDKVNVVVLRSEGEKAFCGGASFDELLAIKDFKTGKEFFMGFARLINSMRKCKKLIIVRVQGKAVGGGVGVIAAADYALATNEASIKLSELALGIGPFVVGPAVERKIGKAAFTAMSMDFDWRDAFWAKSAGLYRKLFSSIEELDEALHRLAEKLAKSSPEATAKLKEIFWEGTENWDKLLEERAEISGKLVLSDFTKNYIKSFKNKK